MTTKHTEGPWDALGLDDRRNDIGIFSPAGDCFVMVERHEDHSDEEVEANARLIAAAPELFAAVKALLASLERADTSEGACCCGDSMEAHGLGSGHSPVDAGDYFAGQAIAAARAAIARAEGPDR
jgi:hypothetical protein